MAATRTFEGKIYKYIAWSETKQNAKSTRKGFENMGWKHVRIIPVESKEGGYRLYGRKAD
jgi:hypothetical protein